MQLMADLQGDAVQHDWMHRRRKRRMTTRLAVLRGYVARHEKRKPKLHWLCVAWALAVAVFRSTARPVLLLDALIDFCVSVKFRAHQPADEEGGRGD